MIVNNQFILFIRNSMNKLNPCIYYTTLLAFIYNLRVSVIEILPNPVTRYFQYFLHFLVYENNNIVLNKKNKKYIIIYATYIMYNVHNINTLLYLSTFECMHEDLFSVPYLYC